MSALFVPYLGKNKQIEKLLTVYANPPKGQPKPECDGGSCQLFTTPVLLSNDEIVSRLTEIGKNESGKIKHITVLTLSKGDFDKLSKMNAENKWVDIFKGKISLDIRIMN
ncbi:006R [Cherax quadricarinatus iridovirus]|uniref:Uncharacterized protein n=1 Tax=Shrimp hemocyte iridescent virus TaxID=2039780 RepID=A0A291B0X9_9VIRU|nr:006R [Cherax quadricarinatus iridovirus]YP_010084896.1 hypothetical protein KM509_gp144 [Shrimp hemocyte iridescent virus]UPA43327.1 hypothetical protein 4TH000053 [Iridovirus CN01]ASZ84986.1 006R [Cherax quadricarinatus iridovirus]ATE87153.1 hypothetical protein [Shrimp hemocyte iridescent virus]UPA43562.1 hypothetical protein 3TG000129 [Iridovirus CN01]UPA43597.1 hypothetical protein 1DG000005 [Iridovirus CN01]